MPLHPPEHTEPSNTTSLPTPTELRAATARLPKTNAYLFGCNISWTPSPSPTLSLNPSATPIFGLYLPSYPTHLASLLSLECHSQLPRPAIATARSERGSPGVDLALGKAGGRLVLAQRVWHPADAVEWLFDWGLRVAEEGDESLPARPGGTGRGVYSRFHDVEVVNWLKVLDVAGWVGMHEWFVGRLRGRIADWERGCGAGGGGRRGAREMKETIDGLDGEGRGGLVEAVAAAVVCGRLQGVPKVFGVDATLVDEIRGAVEERRATPRRLVEITDWEGAAGGVDVQPGSSEADDESASGSTFEVGVLVESSQTELQIELWDSDAMTESESFVQDSILGVKG